MFRLEVPLGLTFRSFDSLIKLVDELSKFDSQVRGETWSTGRCRTHSFRDRYGGLGHLDPFYHGRDRTYAARVESTMKRTITHTNSFHTI